MDKIENGKTFMANYLSDDHKPAEKLKYTIRRAYDYCTAGYNKVPVIQAETGSGKTTTIFDTLIPNLIRDGVQIINYVIPRHEILDDPSEYKDQFKSLFPGNKIWVGFATNKNLGSAYKMKRQLQSDEVRAFVIISTHAWVINGSAAEDFLFLMKELGNRSAWLADEIHHAHTSSSEAYLNDKGHRGNDSYKARMYKFLNDMKQFTKHVYGFSATPTNEQLGHLSLDDFEVFKPEYEKEDILGNYGLIGNVRGHRVPSKWREKSDAVQAWYDEMFLEIQELEEDNFLLSGVGKNTMMIQCLNGNHIDVVLKKIKNDLRQRGSNEQVAIMTGNRGEIHNPLTGKYIYDYSDSEIKHMLNDPNSPVTILLVKQKGNMGMNIHTMKRMFCFRNPKTFDENKDPIFNSVSQLLGRSVRVNKLADGASLEQIKIANTMNFFLPETDITIAAVRKFEEFFVSADDVELTICDSMLLEEIKKDSQLVKISPLHCGALDRAIERSINE